MLEHFAHIPPVAVSDFLIGMLAENVPLAVAIGTGRRAAACGWHRDHVMVRETATGRVVRQIPASGRSNCRPTW